MTNEKAFKKGLGEVKRKDFGKVKTEIMKVLGIATRQMFAKYAEGTVTLDVEKAYGIEEVFSRYGIKNCWGK